MRAFRISRTERANDLSGTGAKLYGGRWNSPGRPVLYCAENISLAMLEILAHADENFLQKDFSVIALEINTNLAEKELSAKELTPAWRSNPHSAATQRLGDEWLQAAKVGILRVPSAVNPLEQNILINPELIEEGTVKIVARHKITFDNRLLI